MYNGGMLVNYGESEMSGGHFDYKQHDITDIAESIKTLIDNELSTQSWSYTEDGTLIDNELSTALNNWGEPTRQGYSAETIAEFRRGVFLLEQAAIYAHRIDWLVSGDDGENSFHDRLKVELGEFMRRLA